MSHWFRRMATAVLAAACVVALPVAQGQRPVGNTGDLFTCGADATVPAAIPVRWETVVLAGDGRLFTPCPAGSHPENHREVREAALIKAALASPVSEVRRVAVQALARMRPAVGDLFVHLADADSRVREEAAFGIGLQLSRPGLDPNVAIGARQEIDARLRRPTLTEPAVRGLLLEAIGATRYGGNDQRDQAEQTLVRFAAGNQSLEVLGAAKGLEALVRQDPRRPVSPAALERLRALVTYGSRATGAAADARASVDARIRRLALQALVTVRDEDLLTLTRATADGDWQVRRIAALGLNVSRPEQAAMAARLAIDPVFQVRYEALGAYARDVTRSKTCAPITAMLGDQEPLVSMRAMDALNAGCADLAAAVDVLIPLADQLGRSESHVAWHRPSRALTALARVRPDAARPRLAAAITHPVWQVRAAAAATGAVLGAPEPALAVSRDAVPNVRTAALEALTRLKTPAGPAGPAIDALTTATDHQLLRAAAAALRGAPAEHRDAAVDALLGAMRRLTDAADDTSRDPRVAILERLGELLPPQRSNDLLPFLSDFDDDVVAAAGKAFNALTKGPAAPAERRRRYPLQPDVQQLSSLPSLMEIELETGVVRIELLPQVAPVTVARVTDLARRGVYTGLTFHRIVPNFVVQGGSPGANEYAGAASRYMRDEPGLAPHLRGAVGISTRGRDTGDAQMFIDLVDVPRLDRDYTVFGYVVSGMEFVDRMLEGAAIKRVSVR